MIAASADLAERVLAVQEEVFGEAYHGRSDVLEVLAKANLQQDKHDIDERRHVDFGQRPIAAPLAGTARLIAAIRLDHHDLPFLFDLTREDGDKLARECFHTPGIAPEIVRQFVVGNHGWNRGDEPKRRSK